MQLQHSDYDFHSVHDDGRGDSRHVSIREVLLHSLHESHVQASPLYATYKGFVYETPFSSMARRVVIRATLAEQICAMDTGEGLITYIQSLPSMEKLIM